MARLKVSGMSKMPEYDSEADHRAVVQGPQYRFTVLTPALLRMEYSEDGAFEDRPSTLAINRRFPVPDFKVKETDKRLDIYTSQLWLTFIKGAKFGKGTLTAAMLTMPKGSWGQSWRFSLPDGDSRDEHTRAGNLGGTVRTLDTVDGRTDMSNGILSKGGFSQLHDHDSMLLTEDGWIASRNEGTYDGYLFGHGWDHRSALKDFFTLSGRPPIPPRHTLGVWYTRFYAYTADEYLGVMDKFLEEGVPLSTAVIDIAWHLMDNVPKGTGGSWSGFTWEHRYYPRPKEFMQALKDRGLKVALNDHPNEGIRHFETKYEECCKFLGLNAKDKLPIPFDVTDRKILEAYFTIVLHDLEKQGADLWWVDWQQNDQTGMPNVDPLWVLNHFHFLDHAKDGRRGMTLSRYAGPGSHRYPLGFSGDHQMTWASLNFEPEFTATASNIGYGWWSHDIGGHLGGYKDEECTARWCQLGCVMPILRLHNNCNPFNYRTTWLYSPEIRSSMISSFRLRHRMIPYTYSCAAVASRDGRTLMEPMYYDHPMTQEAYKHRNAYMFGGSLLAAPITSKKSSITNLGKTTAWLPPGRWVDILSGMVYDGDRITNMYRGIETMPLLGKPGTIIPMDNTKISKHGVRIPESLEIVLVVGADGEFTIVEDDDIGNTLAEIKFSETPIRYDNRSQTLTIGPTTNPLVNEREWSVLLPACNVKSVSVKGKKAVETVFCNEGVCVHIGKFASSSELEVILEGEAALRSNDWRKLCWDRLDRAETDFDRKEDTWKAIRCLPNSVLFYEQTWHPDPPTPTPAHVVISRLLAVGIDKDLEDSLMEVLLAESVLDGIK